MPNDDFSDAASRGQLVKVTNDKYHLERQKKVHLGSTCWKLTSNLTATRDETCQCCRNNGADVSSDERTQKRPRAIEADASGSAKRPRTTSCDVPEEHNFSGCRAYSGDNEDIPVIALFAQVSADDTPIPRETTDPEWPLSWFNSSHGLYTTDDEAHIRSVLSSGTPSSDVEIHLDDDDDLVLEEESRPDVDSCHYVTSASHHIFRDRSAFETYERIEPLGVSGLAQGFSEFAVGRGTVHVRAAGQCAARSSGIHLREALHVPSARSNVVSGPQIDEAGFNATLANRHVTLSLRGSNILDGTICNHGLYSLNMNIVRHFDGQPRFELPHQISRIFPLDAANRGGISVD